MYCSLETVFFTTMKQLVNRHLIKLTYVLDIVHQHITVEQYILDAGCAVTVTDLVLQTS
jgi:hypothetical protein